MPQKPAQSFGPAALVVDDNEKLRCIVAAMLRAVGIYDVFEAADAEQALAVLARRQIDLLIMDSLQPGDGLQFVRALRTPGQGPQPTVPIIMISGQATAARVLQARDAGVNEFVGKPLSAKSLLSRIQRLIDYTPPFVVSQAYVGPCRRRREDPAYTGPERRPSDQQRARA